MSAQLDFKLADLAPWLSRVSEDAQRVDWKPAFKQIALLLESEAKQRFEEGKAPDGTPWKPLKFPRSRKRDKGGISDQKPLRDSGLLMASLSAHGSYHVEEIGASILNWGTNLEYAGVHQFGHTFQRPEKRRGPGQKPWVFKSPTGQTVFTKKIRAHTQTVPARPFLGLNEQILGDIDEILWTAFQKQVLGGP